MAAKVISVINEKGGCGKTNTAINLARNLELRGNRVVLFDNDPQGGSIIWRTNARDPDKTLSVIPMPSPIEKKDIGTFSDYVDYIVIDGCPGLDVDKRLRDIAGFMNELATDHRIPEQVRHDIQSRIFDLLGPTKQAIARNTAAIRVSDFVVVPTKASEADVLLTERLVTSLILPALEMTGKPKYGILINQNKQHNLLLEKKYRSQLAGKQLKTFETGILDRIAYRDTFEGGTTVMDYPSYQEARLEIESFTTELLEQLDDSAHSQKRETN